MSYMKIFMLVSVVFLSFSAIPEEKDNIEYIGSYSSLRLTTEHFDVTELWLWKHEASIIGLFFDDGGLQGDGINQPRMYKIETVSDNVGQSFFIQS